MNPPLAIVKPFPLKAAGHDAETGWHRMSPQEPLGSFAIQALEQAINRARQAEPAQGQAASLSPDVGRLAGLYGWMIYQGLAELSPDLLNADELDAVMRWI